jgi:ribosomal protein S27E
MHDKFISLRCQNCGGKLDVYDDMERFACGHCGTEMIVQRRGGTIALKSVAEAIQKVQVGTDKTAAELAIARYDAELKQLEADLVKVNNEEGSAIGGIGCGAFFVFLSIVGLVNEWFGFAGLFGVAGVAMVVVLVLHIKQLRNSGIQSRIADVRSKIAAKKSIVDQ